MLYWTEYNGHPVEKYKNKDLTIYTFDIETTSYIFLQGKVFSTSEYLSLSDQDKEECTPGATMYIWQFGINDTVYYGRTWAEFVMFLDRLEANCKLNKKRDKLRLFE